MSALLAGLNDQQIEAVTAPLDRPCLVIAGAGSGKTTTLTRRVEHTIAQGVAPAHTVAMTFTKKAAQEMADRLGSSTIAGVDQVWAGTLHSFGYARLRAYREALGMEPLEVLTHPKPHIKRLIGRPDEHYKEAISNFPEMDLSYILGAIGSWQNELVGPDAAIDRAADEGDYHMEWAARMYRAYTKWKARTLRIDFGDMLMMAVEAYVGDPAFLEGDRKRYTHALVDELQDTNAAQWRLVELLWWRQPVFGVGDPRQAIYEWRGARPDQLLGFDRIWPDVVTVNLNLNYRSTPEILAPSQRLIAGTVEANASEALQAVRPPGETPEVVHVSDQLEEAQEVAARIAEMAGALFSGVEYGDCAVLYRTNAQSADFEDVFAATGIPYQVIGSKGFWSRREIRQLLAYVALSADPNDSEALRLAIAAPSRFLGAAFIGAVEVTAKDKGISLVEAVGAVRGYGGRALHRGQADAASEFVGLMSTMATYSPADQIRRVLEKTDFRRWLARSEGSQGEGADDSNFDAVDKLLEAAARYSTGAELLAHAEAQASKSSGGTKPDPKRVQLLTIHRAKGLEWDHVFVVGMCEGLLPHARGELTEERRLAYVAMTRARDTLTLLVPASTYKGSADPSSFLADAGLVPAEGWDDNVEYAGVVA